ncbi:MAG: 3-hydroxyacyl-ACP dehydratase FabZ family protein [Pirellulales bacterium]|nr:3-hydroxyacyl-ACP dehydratase FabZ family protein [Pirellulales bacterium]
MRWFWMDRFTELTSGQSATAVKTVSLSEQQLHDHFFCIPTMPNSLILEGMAQTSGMLVSEYNNFRERVILAKVAKVNFHFRAVPGDTLTYRANLQNIDADGARAATTSHVGDRLQAEAEILFAHIDRETAHRPLFAPGEFLSILRVLKILEVARKPDGSRITFPEHLL